MAALRARPRRRGGFTYVIPVILVAILALVSAATLKLDAALRRSRAEQQLLAVGSALADALQSYADATPAGQSPYPRSFAELLRDPRFPAVRRHLRRVYTDPMTGKEQWGIVHLGEQAGIVAVYSLSDARPIKVGNFPQRYAAFAGKTRLSDWRFGASVKPAPIREPAVPAP